MNIYIGIDPGKTGAVALLTDDPDRLDVWQYPGDIKSACTLLQDGIIGLSPNLEEADRNVFACLEKVHAMPMQGVSSSFNFGVSYGMWQGVLAVMGIPYIFVTPHAWQKVTFDSQCVIFKDAKLSGSSKIKRKRDTKAMSLSVARRLFPDVDLHRKADDGKADALNLARYAKMMVKKGIL